MRVLSRPSRSSVSHDVTRRRIANLCPLSISVLLGSSVQIGRIYLLRGERSPQDFLAQSEMLPVTVGVVDSVVAPR